MTEYGLLVSALYTNISDTDFDSVVSDIKSVNPNCGYRMLNGYLRIRVTQERIRNSMHRVDPCGVAVRWACTVGMYS